MYQGRGDLELKTSYADLILASIPRELRSESERGWARYSKTAVRCASTSVSFGNCSAEGVKRHAARANAIGQTCRL